MLKAYDTFLQSEVPADLAAKSGGFEPYRYECAHCGEEVFLAALDSTSQVTHFRHRRGNSGINCELFLGQCGVISIDACSRKSKDVRAEFYFDSNKKMFFFGLRFSGDEITAYEQQKVNFELRTSKQAQPFYSLPINSMNFVPDIQRKILIEQFSPNYYLSNTSDNVKREHKVFKNIGSNVPTFFKILANDNNYHAKLVRSTDLYTGIPYFVAYQSQHWMPMDSSLPSEIKVESTINFETMGRKFLGKVLTINAKTEQIDALLSAWDYKLQVPETLTLLWPPAVLLDDSTQINTDYAYLFSTFELQPHGNINVHSEDIKKIAAGISKVMVNAKINVYKKNAELTIDKCGQQAVDSFEAISVVRKIANFYDVPGDNSFLFNQSGVLALSKGTSVPLTPASEIRHYLSGYLNGFVIPPEHSVLVGESLLRDILAHYKRTEIFQWDDFDSFELSQTAFQYLESCDKSGKINSAVKLLIQEGRI